MKKLLSEPTSIKLQLSLPISGHTARLSFEFKKTESTFLAILTLVAEIVVYVMLTN